MKQVHFTNLNKTVTVSQDSSVLIAALESNIEINNSCGGNGTCGTCLIIVHNGLENCKDRNELEQEIASSRGFEKKERLACQLDFEGLISVTIP